MDVKNECAALLSNYEVFTLLNDIKAGRGFRKPGKNQQQLSTIVYETSQYLENLPCHLQTPEIITSFMEALTPFRLTKAEKLQLLNTRPTSAVEIQLLIEESEERLTESELEQLLEVVMTTLPSGEETMECSGENSPDQT